MLSGAHVRRLLRPTLDAALRSQPVVAVTGPRTSGKSTLASTLIEEKGGTLLDLDNPDVRTLANSDPVSFVRGLSEPVILDEFQRAPDLLAAIKSELNVDRRPGRYVLTGSARHEVGPELADYLTGRVELLTLWPFAIAELSSSARSIIDRLFDGEMDELRRTSATGRADIVNLVLRGGYPIATTLSAQPRSRWFANLANLIVERAGADVGTVRRPEVLSRMLRLCAARTSQVLNIAEIGRDAGLGRDQANEYVRLLELVYLVIKLPAWSVNLTARVTKRPKLHLVDTGHAAHLQGTSAERLAPTDPTGASRFGSLLETFVTMEIIKQLGWADHDVRAYHYRTADGVEVDLVLEDMEGKVVAIEVEAGGRTTPGSIAGLRHLRDRLGDRFVAGLVLTTGPQAQRLEDRLTVAPIDELWGG